MTDNTQTREDEPDCTECHILERFGCKHPEGYDTSDDENYGWEITRAGDGCPKRKRKEKPNG